MSGRFAPGERVLLRGRVQHVYHAERGEDWETYSLILDDGQNLQTNVKNLRPLKEEDAETPEQEPRAKALTRPPSHKAVRGPREAPEEEVLPPPDQTRDPAKDAPRVRSKGGA